MKNPHGVEPTRFMKKNDDMKSITYDSSFGPIFGKEDIYISYKCNKEDSCYIYNDGTRGYECHPKYKSSLFVNTNGPGYCNEFAVLDYEVYTIDYKNKYTIDHVCEYPDIIWEYLQTKDISEESLKLIKDERKMIDDLDTISCDDRNIRLKISQHCLKNPSELLPDTQLVDMQYDEVLRRWVGNQYQWKLLYRASEHKYRNYAFHRYCDNQGPTLIIIKSTRGWIFGGFTTQSWGGKGIF